MSTKALGRLMRSGLSLFDKLAKSYSYQNIPILMADYAVQRGGILSDFVLHGGEAYMAGGKNGQQYFENVPQFTLNYDTFCARNLDAIKDIVSCFPKDITKGRYATFCYVPMGDNLWQKNIKSHLGGRIVATSEQNLRGYFEEKTNLEDILTAVGLQKNMIPSRVIKNNVPIDGIVTDFMYEKYRSKDGKLVIQRCGEGNNEVGGGKTTEIVSSLEEFKAIMAAPRNCYLKIAKYIEGSNSNLSICCGNTIPSKTMLGAMKGEILPEESRFSPETLQNLLERGKMLGINKENIVVNVHPATLKVVGDPALTTSETNGVGNQLNYNFTPEVMNEIYNIGERIGTLMALCGKVGMCGLDLIITQDGHVYINELNDRQQGPTESASINNEANGLPGIHRESFIMNFADLKNPEVKSYLKAMHEHSREIYDESAKVPSPFYIKVMSKEDCYAKADLKAGDYMVTKTEKECYNWDLQKDLQLDSTPQVNVTNNQFAVRIDTVSAKQDEFIPIGTQLLRINGIATPETVPFSIDEEGHSVLSEQWKEPIESLYKEILQQEPSQLETETYNKSNITASNSFPNDYTQTPIDMEQ